MRHETKGKRINVQRKQDNSLQAGISIESKTWAEVLEPISFAVLMHAT